jgi:hypothetical protein
MQNSTGWHEGHMGSSLKAPSASVDIIAIEDEEAISEGKANVLDKKSDDGRFLEDQSKADIRWWIRSISTLPSGGHVRGTGSDLKHLAVQAMASSSP